jgi:exodeoxyribonuclease V beta subunit
MSPHALDLWQLPLRGSRLIEASAGTGKTWTLSALVVRLVLGDGEGDTAPPRPLLPSDILVMTFTRAATRELTDRIRARLVQAARVLRHEPDAPALMAQDPFLAQLSARYPGDEPEPAPGRPKRASAPLGGDLRSIAAWRLALAADAMDEAAIFTLDAWCQRVLREHAFDSGQLFDETLVADEQALLRQAVQDHWRRHLYPLSPEQFGALQAACPGLRSVDALLDDVTRLLHQPVPVSWPGTSAAEVEQPLATLWTRAQAQRRAALAEVQRPWTALAQALLDWLTDQTSTHKAHWDGRKLAARNVLGWAQTLRDWAQASLDDPATAIAIASGPALTDAARNRFTWEGLQAARKESAPPLQPPEPVAQALDALQRLPAELAALPDPSAVVRAHAVHHVGQRVAQLKAQRGQFGFADLQQRLDAALARPGSGERLREHIRHRYPVALIDEFQDTSPLQYRLLDRLYRVADNDPHTALLLIGDPKQSIYGFRGADIHSYLHARRATEGRHHVLDTNHRSSAAMVAAVNHLFGWREQDAGGTGAFRLRPPGEAESPLPFWPVQAQGRPEAWTVGGQPAPALTLVHDLQPAGSDAHRRAHAQRCAEQVVAWLADPGTGFAAHGVPFKRLRPADIAILVRTGTEAAAVRHALHRRGVASVYLSDRDSVFQSPEATDLLHWLRAVAQPRDVRLARAALGTRLASLSHAQLLHLATDDDALDARMATLAQLHTVWRTRGVLALVRQTLYALALPQQWLGQPDGERRLTNLLHLGELLQNASTDLDGEPALIRWLAAQIQSDTVDGDEPVVRLESDSDLVKVITIHKSKGLEYPVVCLPFATLHRSVDAKRLTHARRADGELTLTPNADDLARAEEDRLREDLRLLYVALTRARHALWVGFACVTPGQSRSDGTHRSALGDLVAGRGASEAEDPSAFWLYHLQALAQAAPHTAVPSLVLQAVDPAQATAPVPLTRWTPQAPARAVQPARRVAQRFETDWGVGSFSSLVRDMASAALVPPPLLPQPAQPAADESLMLFDALALDLKAQAAPESGALDDLDGVRHRFQRGVQAGNFLHAQLEWLADEGFALAHRPDLAARLRRRCERAGHGAQADGLIHWFTRLCQHPLPPGGSLADIAQAQGGAVLPEMAFWLPAQRLHAPTVGELCRLHLLAPLTHAVGAGHLADPHAVPALPERQLHGMLMGFADLVLAHQHRHWVLDHKSNHLGPDDSAYTPAALWAEMAHHRYDVQAALYLLALHRLLRSRLGTAYQPLHHLGGAVYCFLRGLDGPAQGVCLVPCTPELLTLLDALEAML